MLRNDELVSAIQVYEYLRRRGVSPPKATCEKLHEQYNYLFRESRDDAMEPPSLSQEEIDALRSIIPVYKHWSRSISVDQGICSFRANVEPREKDRKRRRCAWRRAKQKRNQTGKSSSVKKTFEPSFLSNSQILVESYRREFLRTSRERKQAFGKILHQCIKRVNHLKRKKEEERAAKARERIEALKGKNYEEYERLLKEQKNSRLEALLDSTKDLILALEHKLEMDIDSCDAASTSIIRQPSYLTGGTLHDYQLHGVSWMVSLYNKGMSGILADEMGLGKTIQTIALLSYVVERSNFGPHLVIVPLSTLQNWRDEFELWAPTISVTKFHGTKFERQEIWDSEISSRSRNVVLTTYETVTATPNLANLPWRLIIVDEGHRLKNHESKLSRVLGRFRSSSRYLLTGTPLQNNLNELWSLLNFLMPKVFCSMDNFDEWFAKPLKEAGLQNEALSLEEKCLVLDRFHRVLRPFLLRRLKADVVKIPAKIERVVNCPLSSWQRLLYERIQNKATRELHQGSLSTLKNTVMQLRKVVNHPFLIRDPWIENEYPPRSLLRSSGKFVMMSHILHRLFHAGHRVLVFFQTTKVIDLFEDFLEEDFAGLQWLRLDGAVSHSSRAEMIRMFNRKDSKYSLFLLSTRAGGVGLNLQSADTIILFDSDWNPMQDLQAINRVHRIGQKKTVLALRLVTESPVERHILDRANEKLSLNTMIITSGCFDSKSSGKERRKKMREVLHEQLGRTADKGDLKTLTETLSRDETDKLRIVDFQHHEISKTLKDCMPMQDSELPGHLLIPDDVYKEDAKVLDFANLGKGKRKRKVIVYDDNLNDEEATKCLEDGIDPMEYARKKRLDS